jgi:hypothetical protein
LPREIEVTSTIRRLVRELVIFVFIAGFLGAGYCAVSRFRQTKEPEEITVLPDDPDFVAANIKPNCIARAPGVTVTAGQIESCPPWVYYEKVKKWSGPNPPPIVFPSDPPVPCRSTGEEGWKEWHPEGCQLTPEEIGHHHDLWVQGKASFDAQKKVKREHRIIDATGYGVAGFGLGAIAGIVVWAFNRAARFAIKG